MVNFKSFFLILKKITEKGGIRNKKKANEKGRRIKASFEGCGGVICPEFGAAEA